MSLFINVSGYKLVENKNITLILDSYLPNNLSTNKVSFDIVFVSKAKIQEMNKKYLNKDSATDVLSFALDQDFQTSSNLDQTINLGDVFICREMAKAKEHEINFLIVHGFLHLIGLDHSSLRQSQKWDKIEKKILTDLV